MHPAYLATLEEGAKNYKGSELAAPSALPHPPIDRLSLSNKA